jgi:hypothetical protein
MTTEGKPLSRRDFLGNMLVGGAGIAVLGAGVLKLVSGEKGPNPANNDEPFAKDPSKSDGGRPVTTEGSTPRAEMDTKSAYERTAKIVNQYVESILDPSGKFKSAARFNKVTEDGVSESTLVIPVELEAGVTDDHGEYRIMLSGKSGEDGLQPSEVTGLQVVALKSSVDSLNATGRENIDPVGGVAYAKTESGWELATWGTDPETDLQSFSFGPETGTQLSGSDYPGGAEGALVRNAQRTDRLLYDAIASRPIGNDARFIN